MTATVKKPFKTALRKFAVGASVSPTDDLVPHDYADLEKRGFIEEAKPAAEPPATSKASPRR